ncbi:pyridoxamine 5'-phosphate oxidase family protein [Variovorax sp. YR752]|uniref:pyridoxamine 5'-phosphate oxidase family protein n=1 Tax=Variovorax sp. YR752 TaxID=1884383 RepID=UPI0031380FA4
MDTAAFHAGEQALQARSGVRERLAAIGRTVIRDHMPDQHRELFGKLPTLLLAVQDERGQPWATMLHGPAGFIRSPDLHTLEVHSLPSADDPVARWLAEGAAVGMLGLEPQTRRRNRANGRVRALHAGGFDVEVLQSFGNCPKYIHAREPERIVSQAAGPAQQLGPLLDATSLALLRRADTLFIASASGANTGTARAEGVDVSHRGGRPGFVQATTTSLGLRLTLPDYLGNNFFNTLGNLLAWPRAGLLVPDYGDGSLLHLAAQASIEFDAAALAGFPGAQRLLHLDVLEGWWRPQAVPLRWSVPEAPVQFGG